MKLIFVLLVFLVVFLPFSPIFSATIVNDPLKIALGSRYLGMGRTGVAVADDVSAIFINPAGLLQLDSFQITAMRANFLNDYTYTLFGTALPLPLGVFGVGYVSNFAEGVPKTVYTDGRIIPSPDGAVFGGNDDCALISFAFGFKPWLSFGANFKYYKQVIDIYSRSGQAFDFGVLFKPSYLIKDLKNIPPLSDLSLGLTFHNIISPKLKWSFDTISQEIPSRIRIGFSTKITEKLLLAIDLEKGITSSSHAGLEWLISDELILRLGSDDGFSNLTIGIGIKTGFSSEPESIKTSSFEFDYSYKRYENPLDSDGGHFFSFSYLGFKKGDKEAFIQPGLEEKEKTSEKTQKKIAEETSSIKKEEKSKINFYGVDKIMAETIPSEKDQTIEEIELKVRFIPSSVKRGGKLLIGLIVPEEIKINRIKVEFKDGGEIFLVRRKNSREYFGEFVIPSNWRVGIHEAIININASNAFFPPRIVKFEVL